MAQQRRRTGRITDGDVNAARSGVTDDIEVEDDTLFLCFWDAFHDRPIIIDADSICSYHSEADGAFIYSVVHTTFYSFNVTASDVEITAALGITPLGIGSPRRDTRPVSQVLTDSEQLPETDTQRDGTRRKQYAFTDEPLPDGHPSLTGNAFDTASAKEELNRKYGKYGKLGGTNGEST